LLWETVATGSRAIRTQVQMAQLGFEVGLHFRRVRYGIEGKRSGE
jgi:hypothetical protein